MVYLFKAVRRADAAPAAQAPRTPIRTSAGARASFSLLGLGLGALACFFMFVGNAAFQLSVAGQISVETSRAMATGCSIAAGLLAALALLIGFIGLFIRGLPMKRVPVLYLLGAILLFATFQTFNIHPVNWPTFMAEFTRSFTNQTDL
jgi:purine-cytosine permease-like protein